jgi:hypothetical protein
MDNANVPKDQHGFALTGMGTVYGSHLAMFNMVQHRYQVVIEVDLPQKVKATYLSARQADAKAPIIVVNPKGKEMHLQDMLGPNGFSSELWKLPHNDFGQAVVLAKGFTATATTVLHNRAFNDSDEYPAKPRYLAFGSGGEAHVSHYLTRQPDYQLLTQLATVPTGVTAAQLKAGVLVDLTTVTENHKPASDPMEPYRNKELAATVAGTSTAGKLTVGPSRWFDTRDLNHEPDSYSATLLSEYIALAPA